ncbi:TRAP transporter small permease [Pollutimonas thiosulfatoxidans]|uniref:TRAP transporter small permease protein n=1 Tax=Pollutimonas thiosulfatoxidans TaxID=2028345 RepID=A0A410GB28_9BURK|nr:TRAP transporter small permease [Pollutimonas thiosulfatoxidans]MBF6616259.1 TRAP transporter small permease [Candidimonas sp.]NYT45917.1 TRAP transporter small permease [Alcaligenaceae bacterium]QAA93496.1 TRAP transporter permease DctQ [Pollutimonas thiosulfatoxidans]
MRRFLDKLYLVSGGLAAVFTVGVLIAVTMSIVTRQLGVHIGGLDAYAGYSMAAAGFLALAHTFKSSEHIRVSLVLAALPDKGRMRLDIFALLVGCLITATLCWFSIKLAMDSYTYNDVSTGNDATPLWIPQIAMAVGTVIFFIAVVDETIRRIKGIPEAGHGEEARYE